MSIEKMENVNPLKKIENSLIEEQSSNIDEVFKGNPEIAIIFNNDKGLFINYIESIFPESKIKDIFQHQTKSEFEDFTREGNGRLGKGFYFSKLGNDYVINESFKKKLVVLNVKNPVEIQGGEYMKKVYSLLDSRNESSDDVALKEKAELEIEKQYQENSDALIGDKNGRLESEIKVFNPVQIHILGSKQDIEQAKEWLKNK